MSIYSDFNLDHYLSTHGTTQCCNELRRIYQKAVDDLEKDKLKYFWITVNPAPNVLFPEFYDKILQYCKRTFITSSTYTLEQRGENKLTRATGFHGHLLVGCPYKTNTKYIKSWTQSTFKSCCGNPKAIHIIETDFPADKLDYMKGLKWDSEKDAKLTQDKLWRAELTKMGFVMQKLP